MKPKLSPNELRTGTYITRKSSPNTICHVTWGVIADIENGEKDYIPIELTEEWLKKFDLKSFKADIHQVHLTKENVGYSAFIVQENDPENWIFIKDDIEYVHQLQNLYFALTGEELKTK